MTMLDAVLPRALPRIGLLAALLAGGLMAAVSSWEAGAHAEHGMPARIQQGTCDGVGPVAFELTGVGATEDVEGNAIPEPEIAGAPTAREVQASVTTVPAALDAIVSGGHAIVVYESDEAMDVTVACGAVGGIVVGEELVVGLVAEGEEGMGGIALLRSEGEQTLVRLFLTPAAHEHGDGAEVEATPAA